ncbi:alpha/beta fold hydrolase [Jannaschia seohaensis]|uniref:Pimeloyl-ACP methyl ester carboxylesterase n=1 Tax=Jannaschia seohaensis TaxID=475081 RepID=A0A2Y9AIS5_9RHOB|nr:alpha/beta fold hydrolase [Jannaschia seohaensis]PWJ20224.1 pimeloyl-ACP methyl ester carboxylesterase [Jannaschia seohaensis]SSA44220.1 Pimeloyl-ACP methyl ester carboxylesterase [Jannaschia seohaensis]
MRAAPGPLGDADDTEHTDRDLLIAAIYEAAADPSAYSRFVAALSAYLEQTAVREWRIRDLAEVDIEAFEADRGLAMHLANLNDKLTDAPHRIPPGSLREHVARRSGLAVLVDRAGHIASLSATAQETFESGPHALEDLATRLHAEDSRHLRDAIAGHVMHGRHLAPRILRGEAFHLCVRTQRCDTDGEVFLCLETLAVDWSPALEAVLRASFSLTPAELRVARMLAAGETAKSIAAGLDRSEGTVRNQIKSILAKTDTGGIANLNRLLALIAETVAGAPILTAPGQTALADLDILTLPDGRAMEVRLQGPVDGRPVLFLHGMLFGSELPPSAIEPLERNHLRLIAPARPNFGMSDPSPGRPEDEPDRLVADLLFLLDAYGVDRTVCLTNIAGSPYGYALAAAAPERISGLVHAASVLPVLKARQFVTMPPTQRLIAFLMRFVPAYLPPLMKSGIAQIRASGEIPFLATLYEEGTCDHAVATRPDLVDLMTRSVHFATGQGYLGCYTDTLHVVRDWSHYATAISDRGIPIIHVHGHADPQYPLDDVARFAARFPSVELRGVEGAGQLLLFDRPGPVIGAVAELLHRAQGAGRPVPPAV